ncbi:MAG TPA: MFS transporter, partial [Terrimicrobiaceae bacterium]
MSNPPNPESLEENAYSKVFWRIIPFIMVCYVFAYLDRINIGFAKLQMEVDLGFSETIYGLGAGMFFIGYFLFEVPSNLALYKVGARLWIARIMITWGIISACFIFVKTPFWFYTLRFLLGAAEAGFYPGMILYLTYWYPDQRRAAIVATFLAAVPIAGILGGPLSGWILDAFEQFAGMRGWQWLFVIEALPATILGILVLFFLDNGIREAKWLSDEEKRILERNIEAGIQSKRKRAPSLRRVLVDKRVWMMSAIYFSFVMGLYGLTFWLPTMVKASGVKSNFMIGLLSAIPFLVAVVAMILAGHSADRRRERRWHLVIPALCGAVGFVVAALTEHNTVIALLFLSLASAGVHTCVALFWSLPTSFLHGSAAAAGIAAVNSIGNLAGFLGPYLVGFLKDATHDNRIGMYILAATL